MRRIFACAVVACWVSPAIAEDAKPLSQEEFDRQSLSLRTALHRDPMLGAPMDRLLALYRKANKTTDLLDIYRNHLAEYPQDFKATTVLVRLLSETGDKEALTFAKTAIGRFATNANLHAIYGQLLKRRNNLEWLGVFDKAAELETDPNRRLELIEILLPEAVKLDRKKIADRQVERLVALASDARSRLTIARSLNKFRFYAKALELATKKEKAVPPEVMVDLELEASEAEAGLGKREIAAARLDSLMNRLAADYWRRPQILKRRLALVGKSAEAKKLIAAARDRVTSNRGSESAWLDLGRTLAGLDFHREALTELLTAGKTLPNSAEIERQTLELFRLLRDDKAKAGYLADRLKQFPARTDLALERIRTLYRLGQEKDAKTDFAALLKPLGKERQIATQLAMARFLRGVRRTGEAAELFEAVIQAAPDRLDVMRELAETHIARQDRYRVRELLRRKIPADAPLENLIDLVQFLIKEELDVEARMVLRDRLPKAPANVDIRCLLLTVEKRLGNFRAGNALIAETQKIADTPAKYRLWLQSAAEFHEEIGEGDELTNFLRKEVEQEVSRDGEWDARRLERTTALVETLAKFDMRTDAIAVLQSVIKQVKDKKTVIRLRRQLVKVMDSRGDAGSMAARIAELEALAKIDPDAIHDYNARVAISKTLMGQHAQAEQIFKKLDYTRIGDVSLLSEIKGLAKTSVQRGYLYSTRSEMYLQATERLTLLNPTDRENWEDWLNVLANRRDEEQLRAAVRRLLAGIEKLPIADETRELLEWHLADSYWRSISRHIARGDDASFRASLPLLDEAARLVEDDVRWLWVTWARAFVLNRLERVDARDASWTELERVAAQVTVTKIGTDGKPVAVKPDEIRILFPDGHSASLAHAKRIAFERIPERAARVRGRSGPLGRVNVAWTFELPRDEIADAITPLPNNRVLIRGASEKFYCVDAKTGKLIWERIGSDVELSDLNPITRGYAMRPDPVVVGDNIVLSGISRVVCISQAKGEVQWVVRVKPLVKKDDRSGAQPKMARVFLFQHEKELLAYDARYSALLRIDPANGKVKWEKWYREGGLSNITYNTAGASLSGDKLLVYSYPISVLDARTGEVIWSFQPTRVRTFPFKLEKPGGEEDGEPGTPVSAAPAPIRHWSKVPPATRLSGGMPRFSGGFTPPSGIGRSFGGKFPSSRSLTMTRLVQPGPFPGAPAPPISIQPRRDMSAKIAVNSLQPMGPIRLSTILKGKRILVPPVVKWAESVRRNAGMGVLAGDWMLFRSAADGQLRSASLHVPLATKDAGAAIYGEYLGCIGKVACFLNAQSKLLEIVRVPGGSIQALSVADLLDAAPYEGVLQAKMDGPVVYITGDKGMAVINVLSAKRIFHAEWQGDAGVNRIVAQAKPQPKLKTPQIDSFVLTKLRRRSFISQPPIQKLVSSPSRMNRLGALLNALNSRTFSNIERGPRAIAVTKTRIYVTNSYRRVVAFDVTD